MADLIVNVAVIGRFQLMPGTLPIKFQHPDVECLVAHAFPNKMEDPQRGIEIDTSDCTVFTVTHLDQGDIDISLIEAVQEIFERSVVAIGEVIIWTKSHDVVGKMSAFMRQIGTLDVKAFFALSANNKLVGWLNPAFTFQRDAAAMMAGFLSNMIISNGPSSNPIPPIARRVMSSLDLINLGFYTESFVNLFSLVDDLSQEVIKAGMAQKGLSEEDQKSLLRAIKEERLKVYLCNLAKLCGWQSLEEVDKEFYGRVVKVNTLRNKIMHGSRRLSRSESIDSSNALLLLIDWLKKNPFGFLIPNFPLLQLAQPTFSLVPLKKKQGAAESDTKVGEGNDEA
jgi:hypothetical protein